MAANLGYEVIAINNILPELLTEKKKKEQVVILPPNDLKIDEELLKSALGVRKKPPRQLSRISTVLHDAGQAHLLNTDKVQMYDLIAVQPTTERTFHQACVDLNIDIITLDVTEKRSYKMKRQPINAAVNRGIHFELIYGPAIRDPTMKRYLISMAETLMFAGKGKNVILTSGCEKPIEMRGPHDIANLGKILFLNEEQARRAVTSNCRSLLCHSEARRAVQSVLQIEKTDSLSESDAWLLEKCRVDQVNGHKSDQSSKFGKGEKKRDLHDLQIGDDHVLKAKRLKKV